VHLLETLTYSPGRNYGLQMLVFSQIETARLYTDSFRSLVSELDPLDLYDQGFEGSDANNLIEKTLNMDISSYLPDCLLVKMDIATMANSLEARSPFLDHQLMEFVASIPPGLKLRGRKTKYVLKMALNRLLPGKILERKKMGFGVPIAHWFRNQLMDYVYGILLDETATRRGYFCKESIRKLLDAHTRMRQDHSARIWALLNLELWHQMFIDRRIQNDVSTARH